MSHHEIKIIDPHYTLSKEGKKPFEIRKNDRDYKVGDFLIMQKWDPEIGKYTQDPKLYRLITCITDFEQQEGNVVLGIREPTEEEMDEYFICAVCLDPMGGLGRHRWCCSSSCARDYYD